MVFLNDRKESDVKKTRKRSKLENSNNLKPDPSPTLTSTVTPTSAAEKNRSRAWLRLACANLSPRQLTRLLDCVDQPEEIFEAAFLRHLDTHASPRKQKDSGTTAPSLRFRLTNSEAAADRALLWAQQPQCHLLTRDCPDYPALLQQIADPPAVLFVEGNCSVLQKTQLAIVGSRRATQPARRLTRQWSAELAQAGLVISSGLARGIDASAHVGCLDAGGATLAVMATGPDDCYPAQHEDLHRQLIKDGASVTEFPPGTSAQPRFFPQRNRLISGMATATLVVEAGIRSGTLVTARHAVEQNRDVFAMPGSVLNPLSAGCHLLIQQGAKLVHQVSDITDELSVEQLAKDQLPLDLQSGPSTDSSADTPTNTSTKPASTQAKTADSLLHSVGYDPFTADTLNESSDLSITDILVQLQTWELEGKIKSLGDGRYQCC